MHARATYKPLQFRAKTAWTGARRAALSSLDKQDVAVGSPPEFRGERQVWAPEELLIGAVNTCIMLTFLTMAEARDLMPVAYESDAEGTLRHTDGLYRITEIVVRPRITVREERQVEPTRKLIDNTEPRCFMSASVTAEVSVAAEVVVRT
jgi:peroxiredoxin-like protein